MPNYITENLTATLSILELARRAQVANTSLREDVRASAAFLIQAIGAQS